MCLPAPDIRQMMGADQRLKWASQLAREGNTKGADHVLAGDRALEQFRARQKSNEALIAQKKMTPDQADEVMRKTGTSPLLQVATGKGSRRNAFIDGPAGIKSLLGGK